jgi:hypothetical protein
MAYLIKSKQCKLQYYLVLGYMPGAYITVLSYPETQLVSNIDRDM